MTQVGDADFGRSLDWPHGLFETLDAFRQGHIIRDVPLAYFSSEQRLAVEGEALATAGDSSSVIVEARSPYALVLTQACDIVKRTHPWLSVAPVYDADERLDSSRIASAKAWKTFHLVPLTMPWAGDGSWVADLRLEAQVEKSIMFGRTPLEAFANEVDYARLTERLAGVRLRPAVPTQLYVCLINPLFEAIAGSSLLDGVRELRLQFDHHSQPSQVSLFVVCVDHLVPREPWDEVFFAQRDAAETAGITLTGVDITTLEEMTAAEYLTSVRVEGDSS